MSSPEIFPSVDDDTLTLKHDPSKTTARLLEFAAKEFIERGYEAARVSDIARRAGVTTGAIYARWPNKTDVMVAALNHIFQKILPDGEIEALGVSEKEPLDIMAVLGGNLLVFDENKDVMVRVFGSARNNEAIRACLQTYLDDEADQLSRLVEEGKKTGLFDPAVSTTAISLLCQSLGLAQPLAAHSRPQRAPYPKRRRMDRPALEVTDRRGPPTAATSLTAAVITIFGSPERITVLDRIEQVLTR